MSFSDLGYEKAQLEIQQHEEQSPLYSFRNQAIHY